MSSSIRWETPEEILAARDQLERDLEGYRRPAAYALGMVDSSADGHPRADDVFPVINHAANMLPAVVLATVCGHTHGTSTYHITHAQLDQAIEMLTPAEACTEYDHPNLSAWRDIRDRARHQPRADVIAVFLGSSHEHPGGRWERLLHTAITE